MCLSDRTIKNSLGKSTFSLLFSVLIISNFVNIAGLTNSICISLGASVKTAPSLGIKLEIGECAEADNGKIMRMINKNFLNIKSPQFNLLLIFMLLCIS